MASEKCKSEFKADYIIVGGGNAGLTLAKILSDVKGVSVIVVEAGSNISEDEHIVSTTLGDYLYNVAGDGNPKYTQQGMSGFNPGIPLLPRSYQLVAGRGIGGSSSINGMQWVRATDPLLNQWASSAGPGGEIWSAANAVPNGYTPLEKWFGVPAPTRGVNGPITVRQSPPQGEASLQIKQFVDSFGPHTGNPLVDDYNLAGNELCQSYYWNLTQQPVEPYTRVSSASAFLNPYVEWSPDNTQAKGLDGRKLRVLAQTTADRIIWGGKDGKTAIGVHAIRQGISVRLMACKEVILSAGLHSSSILQRSGVGDQDLLNELEIPVVFNNVNVGLNYQNHPIGPTVLMTLTPPVDVLKVPQDLFVGAIFAQNPTLLGDDRRSVQILGFQFYPGLIAIETIITQIQSKGYSKIQNKDPFTVALVQQGLLVEQPDYDQLATTYTKYIAPAMDDLVASGQGWNYAPGSPDSADLNNPLILEQLIRSSTNFAYHYVSTNLMKPLGPANQGGVVDAVGRVHGVTQLRVVDDSIIPLPDGNTQSTAYLVAWIIGNEMLKNL